MRLEYFQMIDRVVAIDADARLIRTASTVPQQSTIFEGHFPTYPLMPGVLLTECMAQTVGWLISVIVGFTTMPILVGVKEAKFRTLVLPGDALEFDGKIVHEGSGFIVGGCQGLRGGQKVCDAQLTYRMMPFASPQFREALLEWAQRINVPVGEFIK